MSASAAMISLPATTSVCPQLQVVGGTDANKSFALSRSVFMVGRLPCCELKLKHTSVALIHCVFLYTPSGLAVRDCNTETGTSVNGIPVVEQLLRDKDTLKIGPFNFQVNIPAEWTGMTVSIRPEAGKVDGSTSEALKQLREERRKTQAFVDEQLSSIRIAREEMNAEEQVAEERHQAREVQLQSRQGLLATFAQELEEREHRLADAQKAYALEKEQRDQEEQNWRTRLQEADAGLAQIRTDYAALSEQCIQERESLTTLRQEQEILRREKSELNSWLEEHRGVPERLAQERDELAQMKATLAEEQARLQHEKLRLEELRNEHQSAVLAFGEKERSLEASRAADEQDKAAFAELILQHQAQEKVLEERQAQLLAATSTWEERRGTQEQELANWMVEQRRLLAEQLEHERMARLKDIVELENQTLAELLEWLVQTENYLTTSLDAARESRANLLTKRSRVVRNER